jgi:hypothetical protein
VDDISDRSDLLEYLDDPGGIVKNKTSRPRHIGNKIFDQSNKVFVFVLIF